jgi:hypothetical protein
MNAINRFITVFRTPIVLGLTGGGLYTAFSGITAEVGCSANWGRPWTGYSGGCSGSIYSYWVLDPVLIALGGTILLGAFLFYKKIFKT